MIIKTKLLYLVFILSLILTQGEVFSQSYLEGALYYGRNGYIEYQAGGLPLIISVPHGGYRTPDEIVDRACGSNGRDSYTAELASEISDEVFNITGCYPHIIYNRLARIKLDANRVIDEATCGDAISAIAYTEFNTYIDSAKAAITRKYGKGLTIDLHGQVTHGPRIELGYMITYTELAKSDAILNTVEYINKTSIRNLVNDNVNNLTYSELLKLY